MKDIYLILVIGDLFLIIRYFVVGIGGVWKYNIGIVFYFYFFCRVIYKFFFIYIMVKLNVIFFICFGIFGKIV